MITPQAVHSTCNEVEYPMAIFRNEELAFCNPQMCDLLNVSAEEIVNILKPEVFAEQDKLININGISFYHDDIKEYCIILASEESRGLRSRFFEFKKNLFSKTTRTIKTRLQEHKQEICDTIDNFESCIPVKKEKKKYGFFGLSFLSLFFPFYTG